MKSQIFKLFLSAFLILSSQAVFAQAEGGRTSATVWIIVFLAILVLSGVLFVADNLLQIEGSQSGASKDRSLSIFPAFKDIISPKLPAFVGKDRVFNLTRGYDIKLKGEAEKAIGAEKPAQTYALSPKDFIGMSPIPKVVVNVGDEVKAGDVILFDKKRPEIKYSAPVSGEVIKVERGEKRSINEVVILADKEIQYRSFDAFDYKHATREAIVQRFLESGIWPFIRQRPFGTVPEPGEVPRDIFISTFDSAPLAPDLDLIVEEEGEAFQAALDVLGRLTSGNVYLGLNANKAEKPSPVFWDANGVEKVWFKGPHPSGNVGVQIHHIAPVNKGEVVWTLGVQDVLTIGRFVTEHRFDASRIVVLTGNEVEQTGYFKTYVGANIASLTSDNLKNDNVRIISGDVLSGKKAAAEGHVGFYDDQITVVEEGDKYEMFGWLLPITPRPSLSKTFIRPKNFSYRANTNTHGENRAFVVTGQYEKVLPMDIYPQHLFKAILMNDFERMEGLGIYELAKEDIALCEFACTSKQPLQDMLHEGLEALREQG